MSLSGNAKSKKSRSRTAKNEAMNEVEKEPLKRLNVNVPESRMKAFKLKAIESDRDMGSLVNEWIEEFLQNGRKGK